MLLAPERASGPDACLVGVAPTSINPEAAAPAYFRLKNGLKSPGFLVTIFVQDKGGKIFQRQSINIANYV